MKTKLILKFPDDAVPLTSDELHELTGLIARHRQLADAATVRGGPDFDAPKHNYVANELRSFRERQIAMRN